MDIKVVIVGDGACGKTCLLASFTINEFPDTYVPTIYDTQVKTIDIDNYGKVNLKLWDTAGEEDYDRLRPLSYANTDVVLLCFSIDRPDSLYNAKDKWSKEIQYFLPNVPIILVGNKLDLRTDPEVIKALKEENSGPVTTKEAKEIAKSIKAALYIECSAKTMFNVRNVFSQAAKIALMERRKHCCSCVML